MAAEVKRNCLLCVHCGPAIGELIRCDHPQWEQIREVGEDDTELRTMDAQFAEICEDFQRTNRANGTDGQGGADS